MFERTERKTENTVRPDKYYLDESKKAFQRTIDEAKAQNKSLEETRSLLHRSYPFGAQRKGRPYKIWYRELAAVERRLGIQKRYHKGNEPKVVQPMQMNQAYINKLEPIDTETAAWFLRNICKSMTSHNADHDCLRVVLKIFDLNENPIKYETKRELAINPAEREAEYIEAAHAAWGVWSEIESEKL